MDEKNFSKALGWLIAAAAIIVIIEYVFIAFCGGLSSL